MIDTGLIIDRLNQFGYLVKIEDEPLINYELNKVINHVYDFCNITLIPPTLEYTIIDYVCAQFLYNLKNNGKLDGFDYRAVVKEIKEGDTTIKYANGQGDNTPENRFDAFIKKMEGDFNSSLITHRTLRW